MRDCNALVEGVGCRASALAASMLLDRLAGRRLAILILFVGVSVLTRAPFLGVPCLDLDEAAHLVVARELRTARRCTSTLRTTARRCCTPSTRSPSRPRRAASRRSAVGRPRGASAHGVRRERLLRPRPARDPGGAALPRLRGGVPRPRHALGLARGADAAAARGGTRARARDCAAERGRLVRRGRARRCRGPRSAAGRTVAAGAGARGVGGWSALARRRAARLAPACARAGFLLPLAACYGAFAVRGAATRPRVLDLDPQPRVREQPDPAAGGPRPRRVVAAAVPDRDPTAVVGGLALALAGSAAPGCRWRPPRWLARRRDPRLSLLPALLRPALPPARDRGGSRHGRRPRGAGSRRPPGARVAARAPRRASPQRTSFSTAARCGSTRRRGPSSGAWASGFGPTPATARGRSSCGALLPRSTSRPGCVRRPATSCRRRRSPDTCRATARAAPARSRRTRS